MVASLYATSAEIENIMNEDRLAMLKACDRYGAVDGSRVDAEEGKLEYIVINGWESVEAHRELFALMIAEEGYRERWEGCVKGSEVRHMRVLDSRRRHFRVETGLGLHHAILMPLAFSRKSGEPPTTRPSSSSPSGSSSSDRTQSPASGSSRSTFHCACTVPIIVP
jgi:hypothetical protein